MARFERKVFGGRRFGPHGGGFERDRPKPVKVGEEYDVEINEVGSRGDGIARVKNFVVFVNGTKQGEKAHIKIVEVKNKFAIGKKTEKLTEAEVEETVGDELTGADATEAEEVTEEAVAEAEEE
jgi:predicted RNA-binding protein with TRAM domain